MTRLVYYLFALMLCVCLAGCCCCVPFGGGGRSRPASITVDPYPGARQIGSTGKTTSWTGGGVSTTSIYVTSAPLAKVAAFYENDRHIRAKSGWLLTSKSVEMYGSSAGTGTGNETATIDRRAGDVHLSIGLAKVPNGNTKITVTHTAPR